MFAESDRLSASQDSEESGGDSSRATPELAFPNSVGQRSLAQRLRSGASWLVLGRVCSIGAFLGAHILLGRYLTAADYAAYATASATAVLLATFVVFGTPKVLIRALKMQLASDFPEGSRSIVASCFMTISVVASIAILVFLMGSEYAVDLAKWRGIRDYSFLVACWGCLSAACLVSAGTLEAVDEFRFSILIGARNGGALTNLLFLAFAVVAQRSETLNLGVALGLQVALNALCLVLSIYLIRRSLVKLGHFVPTADVSQRDVTSKLPSNSVRWFLKESWPNLVVQITTMTTVELQIILLGFLASEREIADYNAVLRLIGVVGAFHALATAAIAPFVAELIARDNTRKLERLLRGSATLVAIPTLALTGLFLVFSEQVLEIAFDPEFAGGAWALRFAAIGCVVGIISGSNGLVLVMSGRQQVLMRYSVAASLVFVVSAIPATAYFGINGTALTVSLVFGIYNVLITLLVKSQLGIWIIPTMSPWAILATFNAILRQGKSS